MRTHWIFTLRNSRRPGIRHDHLDAVTSTRKGQKGRKGVGGKRENLAPWGFPGSPEASTIPRPTGMGAVCAVAARSAAPCAPSAATGTGFCLHLPRSWVRSAPQLAFFSYSGLISPLALSLRSGAVVILTSASRSGGRSGSRRRNGRDASIQAGGGAGPEARRTAPHRKVPRCTVSVRSWYSPRQAWNRTLDVHVMVR